ncbi:MULTISPECIES: carbohydrate ABC transporter permease [Thermoactinomyces]|jgi:putative chitobiose transport system permease protein|uniref:Carbohydrate ABC transporter permease n=1 Tax=Thermoactinomyces daqus TaxID=1329516 RepID=A0A7W1X8U2_9BACL|nr:MULTISPECIES: carbohydrate ABC transporter permease [Thermoactinomyces]MBA4542196.1 carbohydrate ABC transporter permease [Thermoactinomyces daqus]MBH8598353.1 carbohydrate ABC transporter permease [Thermoactinomyces sp. CICC 10523]MBH8604477.1 carbohydrate ABC transporter permease [Thermoactinomyces sp. CICC 10522]MBH8607522.1 carbohydrate ABC transporter permease [Thermoactinomyces sp. CICC 10521]
MSVKRRRGWLRAVKMTLMYLLLTVIAVIFIGPFLWLLSTAFKSNGQDVFTFPPDLIPKPPVWDQFVEALTVIPFPRYLLNTFILIVIMVPAHLFLTSLTAYPLARMTFPGRNLIFYAIIGTMFFPEEGKLVPLFIIVQKLGLIDSWWGLIIPGLVGGFSVFLMRQAYLTIPKELEEAAILDGCGPLRLWWSIMLPLTKPTLAALSVFSFISVWNSFIWPLIVLKNDHLYPLALGLAYLSGTFGDDVRAMAAGTVISLVPIIVFYLLMQRYFVSGMQGAIKQ